MTAWLLVHSPLLGPGSWAPVAAELRDAGDTVAVPDLRPALSGGTGYTARQAALAATAAPPGPVVLAGHSGAGPLLPAVAAELPTQPQGCVLVDAGLPHPGRTRRSTLPAELAAHLDALVSAGWLPPWPQWWPPEALAELLPDEATRAALEADSPRLPAGLFDEPLPAGDRLPPGGYVQLSEGYADAAEGAALRGWPVEVLDADHLAVLTRPGEVARLMRAVVAQAAPRTT